MMADWLRTTQIPTTHSNEGQALEQRMDFREMLSRRYPHGLISEAELDALLGVLHS
jgi:hypothetical protein